MLDSCRRRVGKKKKWKSCQPWTTIDNEEKPQSCVRIVRYQWRNKKEKKKEADLQKVQLKLTKSTRKKLSFGKSFPTRPELPNLPRRGRSSTPSSSRTIIVVLRWSSERRAKEKQKQRLLKNKLSCCTWTFYFGLLLPAGDIKIVYGYSVRIQKRRKILSCWPQST